VDNSHKSDAAGKGSGSQAASPVARGRAAATFAASVTFDEVSRHYGDAKALDRVTLEIAPGELVCLLGPSGCGKTTLLRIAAGIERPTSGRVLINNKEVASDRVFVPPEKRGVGLMFQDFALFPHLTIVENVAFGLKALAKPVARTEALAMLSRVGLETLADEYPHTLSGGQQQRVALARAIVPRPSVMLMDEPFSGLDVQLREAMQEETLTLLRETRATSIIVTHSPDEALRLGDRIAVLRQGRVVQVGKAVDLYAEPKELFVARLFSDINEVPLTVSGGAIDTPFGRLPVTDASDGDTVILCIRERGVRLSPDPTSEGLAGRVLHGKFLGDEAWLDVAVEGFESPLRVRTADDQVFEQGAEVRVAFDLTKALVFTRRGTSPDTSPEK
jgi:iron(III) transport system ATP-binding protein